jgi:uncharacterized small protein (DUF1192 family)
MIRVLKELVMTGLSLEERVAALAADVARLKQEHAQRSRD